MEMHSFKEHRSYQKWIKIGINNWYWGFCSCCCCRLESKTKFNFMKNKQGRPLELCVGTERPHGQCYGCRAEVSSVGFSPRHHWCLETCSVLRSCSVPCRVTTVFAGLLLTLMPAAPQALPNVWQSRMGRQMTWVENHQSECWKATTLRSLVTGRGRDGEGRWGSQGICAPLRGLSWTTRESRVTQPDFVFPLQILQN